MFDASDRSPSVHLFVGAIPLCISIHGMPERERRGGRERRTNVGGLNVVVREAAGMDVPQGIKYLGPHLQHCCLA